MDRCVGLQHDPRAIGHIRFFYAWSILVDMISSKGGSIDSGCHKRSYRKGLNVVVIRGPAGSPCIAWRSR